MENESTKNEIVFVKETRIKADLYLSKILQEFKTGFIDPYDVEELRKNLKSIRKSKASPYEFENLLLPEHIQVLRKFLFVEEKSIKMATIKILRYLIELTPSFSGILISKMYPIAICKLFEDHKYGAFEERLECFKFINTWLKYSESNFPLIFCQGVVAIARGQDEYFKKGALEFLRTLAVKRPDHCSLVGGFKLLISALIDDGYVDISDNIFYTLLYVINNPRTRIFFNGFEDLYKIFSIFTKSDFTIKDKDKEPQNTEERNKLEVQLALSKRIIEKLLKTWPGYSLLIDNYMAMGSIIESLNTDTSLVIKRHVLDMVKEIIENEYNICDNFTRLASVDECYVNKIYLAYVLQGLHNNKLYECLIKFIEKENNPLSDYAQKIALKFTILYSKLSNTDLQLPFLNQKLLNRKKEEIEFGVVKRMKQYDDEVINMKIKIMNLLDQTFYHFNCKDLTTIEVKDLSDIVILSMNTIVNLQHIKKYNNQYSIDTSKKELYLIDDSSFQQILKNSKIMDKDFNEWEWRRIDEIVDIIENRKELIPDLYRQRFFKKLLNAFMPSKNLFVNVSWNSEQFIYASVGAKFFKILSSSIEGIRILETSPEEYYFSKNKTWYEDVHSCIEASLSSKMKSVEERKRDPGPFSLKRVCKSMSRQIFVFLGILSQSALGEEYLEKKGFYSLMARALTHSGRFDYMLTCLIDNLNFNTKNAVSFMQAILDSGSKRIKRYAFEHIRCLFQFGKDVQWSFKYFKYAIDHDPEIGLVVVNILSSLFTEGKYIEEFLYEKSLIQKLLVKNKNIIYLMMRNKEAYDSLASFIDEELKVLNVRKIVEDYSIELEDKMNEIFNTDDQHQENYYLHINLPKIENQYENFTELFWIKQLPFNINIGILDENGHTTIETVVLNTYLEFHDSNRLILYSIVHDEIKISKDKHSIKFICMLGDQIIDSNCKMIYYANFLTFDQTDFKSMTEFYKNNNSDELFYRMEKDGVVINCTQDPQSKSRGEYTLYSIYFYIKIKPEKKLALKTPINLLTELPNSEEGMGRLVESGVVDVLFSYVENPYTPIKQVKSALWILGKICSKEFYGKILSEKYKILERINIYFANCEDFAMKGTIVYILCYIAQNREMRPSLEKLNWKFFYNTDICFPHDMKSLFMKPYSSYENKKIKEDLERINKSIILNDKSNDIYANITNLLNTLTYKQSYEKLNEIFKTDSKSFSDPQLLVKIYAILSRYKFRQPLRRFILMLFENALGSQEIIECCQKIMEGLGKEMF